MHNACTPVIDAASPTSNHQSRDHMANAPVVGQAGGFPDDFIVDPLSIRAFQPSLNGIYEHPKHGMLSHERVFRPRDNFDCLSRQHLS